MRNALCVIRLIPFNTAAWLVSTQPLAHALWERTLEGNTVTETLTRNHQRFLRGLASEPPGVKPFSSDFVQQYGLRTPSNAQRAADSLLEKDVIDREDRSFIITDRFFRLWIRRLAAGRFI